MRVLKSFRRSLVIASWVSAAVILMLAGRSYGQVQGQVIAESVPTNSTPRPDEIISVAINIDMRGVQPPDNRLNAYQASMTWNPAVIRFIGLTPAPAPWNNPTVDTTNAASGKLDWNDFIAGGVDPAKINVLNVNFRVTGAAGSTTTLDLSFSAMTNSLLRSLLANLTTNDGVVVVQGVVQPLVSSVEITLPQDSANVCSDSLEVKGTITITGGVPPYSTSCEVNGIAAVLSGSTFSATVPVAVGETSLIATCTVVDNAGNQDIASDTVRVFRAAPPTCELQITSPQDGAVVCDDSVEVTGVADIAGGLPPVAITFEVNGVNANIIGNNFSVAVPVGNGLLIAILTVRDGCGNETVCRDTVRVARPSPLVCETQITSPKEGAFICGDSITVTGVTNITGGLPPYSITCSVNGFPAEAAGNMFTATVVLEPGVEFIIAVCAVSDSCSNQAVCQDTVHITRPAPPVCKVQITSPDSGAFICSDTLTVTGVTTITGGLPPFSTTCSVNGVLATVDGNTFSATIVIPPGVELIVATCTVTDSCGNQAVCQDSIRIARPSLPACEVQITSPLNNEFICQDSVTVVAMTAISGAGASIQCTVNGILAEVTGDMFSARVPLSSGNNLLVATCTVVDSCGQDVVCSDSSTVFRDDIAPRCTFTLTGAAITGRFIDNESGIAGITPVKLKNATLTVDPFTAGDHRVKFRLDAIDPANPMGFSINTIDVCGNTFNCDPVLLSLSADDASRQRAFTFPSADRYLHLTNHGLSEIRIVLNEKRFMLITDPNRARQESNAYVMPSEGTVIFDLLPHLREGENENDIFVAFAGPPGTSAEFALMDVAEYVDYVLDIRTTPVEFYLAQNYPNPFNPTTNIRYDVPERMTEGAHVQLRIYNILGEVVRTLIDEMKFAGQHTAQWDGRNERGEVASTGIYIYQLVAGNFRETRRMILQK